MKRYRWLFALPLFVGFLTMPELTVNAARKAMYVWAQSVAPSLLPFMMLMPALTCPDAVHVYERIFGRLMRPLFNLPGAAAPAILIGMTAGSPAGAVAAARIAAETHMTRGCLERIVLCVSGMSPAFLLTGVGIGMFGSVETGMKLVLAQLASQLLLLLSTRKYRCADGEAVPAAAGNTGAVGAVMNICGYMILFSAASAVISEIVGGEWPGLVILCAMDVPSGAAAIAESMLGVHVKIPAIAACCGFGGLCICAQNLRAVGKNGVRPGRYLLFRAINAAVMCLLVRIELKTPHFSALNWEEVLPGSALFAVIFLLPVFFSWNNNAYLNRKSREEKMEE